MLLNYLKGYLDIMYVSNMIYWWHHKYNSSILSIHFHCFVSQIVQFLWDWNHQWTLFLTELFLRICIVIFIFPLDRLFLKFLASKLQRNVCDKGVHCMNDIINIWKKVQKYTLRRIFWKSIFKMFSIVTG